MKRHLLSAIAIAAMAVGTAAQAGPVIIDGTDSADHGSFNGVANVNGWEYMQRALTNLGNSVIASAADVVTVIGTDSGSQSRNAITSAFNLAGLAGWTINYVSGAAAINAFMSTLSTTTTGILYLSTAGLVSGDMDTAELAAVNAAAAQINTFVGGSGNPAAGGALFAQGEDGAGSFGWLSTLIPGLIATDVGAAGIGTDVTLTAAGTTAFPGLSNADLAGADPWHNYFSGSLGGLSVLGVANDRQGVSRSIILGGGAGTILQCGQPGQPACPTVPEPGSMLLVATAGLALLGLRRRRQGK